jgi:hypothetical protein
MQTRLIFGILVSICPAVCSTHTAITLSSSSNPAKFGSPVTLTALVTPSAANGKVTFYDGVTVLGTSAVTSGGAALTTSLMASGAHSVKAYYSGGPDYISSTSTPITIIVAPVSAFGFLQEEDAQFGGQGLLVADFNGDGKVDVVTTSVGSIHGVKVGSAYVALGNGDGTFRAGQVLYQSSSGQLGDLNVVAGDFNGDGNSDIVLSDAGTQTVYVFLGNGDGTFQPSINYPANGNVASIAADDFNEDGKLDLVLANYGLGVLSVQLGNGDGTFQSPTNYTAPYVNNVVVGDFNGDGVADLAFAGQLSQTVSVFLGRGDGTFRAPINSPAIVGLPAAADLNGDAKLDLAIAGQNGDLFILLGNGDGSFQRPASYTVPFEYFDLSLAIGDINGDGKPDIVVGGDNPGVLLGNGDGTFQQLVSVGASTGFTAVIADFNGDGRADIALTAGYLAIFPGAGPLQMGFASQPLGGVIGMAMTTFAVREQDASGKGAMSYANVPITLTSTPAGVISTMTTDYGVAIFDDVIFSAPGTYSLAAGSPGFNPVISNSFQIAAPGNIIVSGQVTVSGVGLGQVTITVDDLTGLTIASTTTNASGSYLTALPQGGTYTLGASLSGYSFSAPVTVSNLTASQTVNFAGIAVSNSCVGIFLDASNIGCSGMDQGAFQGNLAVSIGAPVTYYGAMTLAGRVPFGDAAGMALYNAGGGGGASVSLDLYNTPFNGGIPQAKIKAIDDGHYSDHLTFWTKTPGGPGNPVTEKVRITSNGIVGIGTSNPTLGPLQMGSGAYVSAGGVWTNASDRDLKENFVPVAPADILLKIDALPVMEWNFRSEDPSVRHIGPVAQDFFSIFRLGTSSTSISTIDPSGIALAGIQGLDAKSEARGVRLAELKKQVKTKTEEIRSLRERLRRLESLLEQITAGNLNHANP